MANGEILQILRILCKNNKILQNLEIARIYSVALDIKDAADMERYLECLGDVKI